MTDDSAEGLWRRAAAALAARGQWPPAASTMTPAEIARALRREGDDRLRRFVDYYYYPERYGHTTGAMTADQAERIVEDIEGARASSSAGAGAGVVAARGDAASQLCSICGKRPRQQKREERA